MLPVYFIEFQSLRSSRMHYPRFALLACFFFNQLEKSREATDIANVRSAYAEVLTSVMSDNNTDVVQIVQLKQKKDD